MTGHLHLPSHLPHPQITEAFVAALREGLAAHLHHAPIAHTDPAVVDDWATWTPVQWGAPSEREDW